MLLKAFKVNKKLVVTASYERIVKDETEANSLIEMLKGCDFLNWRIETNCGKILKTNYKD